MARRVQIDFTDEIIEITLGDQCPDLQVHKHLLCERSDLLRADVEEKGYLVWNHIHRLDLASASQYLGFLYGQPMWVHTPGSDIDKAWSTLNNISRFSMEYEDFDAADACLDGMRELLEHWYSGCGGPLTYLKIDLKTPCGRLMLDYMVHRNCNIKQWIEAYEKCNYRGDAGSLQAALSKKFAEEAQRKKDKIAEPDLIERCRYHLHVEKGLPCYLDK